MGAKDTLYRDALGLRPSLLAGGWSSGFGQSGVIPGPFLKTGRAGNPSTREDLMTYISLNVDLLRAGITVLCDLLGFIRVQRLACA